jgi:hypothetical protein
MSPSAQFPNVVMIIRHGEKPGDPTNDKDGGPDLSILGSARAAALPSLFIPNPLSGNIPQLTCKLAVGAESQFTGVYDDSSKTPASQSRFLTPSFLFATAPSNSSSRPVETITPLVQALQFSQNNPGLTINDNFTNDTDPQSKDGVYALAAEILNNPTQYGGKNILIAWHHGTIPLLTEQFKVPTSQLPFTSWPGTVFDFIFKITWPNGQATLEVDFQQLLFGDTTSLLLPLTPPSQSSH